METLIQQTIREIGYAIMLGKTGTAEVLTDELERLYKLRAQYETGKA